MYDSIRRLLTFFLRTGNRPDPSASRLLCVAARQQAIFQMAVGREKASPSFRYMVCRGVRSDGVVLASRDADAAMREGLKRREFSFRFLVQEEMDKFPRLHTFQGTVTAVHKDEKAITVAFPANITTLEQRRNVRLKLHRRHLPRLGVWGMPKGESQERILKECGVVEPESRPDEVQAMLKNISAGGLRLSLPWQAYVRSAPFLSQGCRLLVQLEFTDPETGRTDAFVFVAKVSNSRVTEDPATRPEFGLQFVAVRQQGAHARWQDVQAEGSLDLLKLLQSYQLEYYRELKRQLALREEPDVDPLARTGRKDEEKVA